MAYFPFFADLDGVPGLIVGGGAVARRKAEKLAPYGPALTVAAPDICPELAAIPGLTLRRRPFRAEDLAGQRFVVAATDDRAVNREVAALCRAREIPVNAVDDREACTFLFPALIRRGALSVGVSTAGASPTAAVYLKERIEALLPGHFAATLDWLEAQRPAVLARVAAEGERKSLFARLFDACMERGGPLPPEALADFWREYEEERR